MDSPHPLPNPAVRKPSLRLTRRRSASGSWRGSSIPALRAAVGGAGPGSPWGGLGDAYSNSRKARRARARPAKATPIRPTSRRRLAGARRRSVAARARHDDLTGPCRVPPDQLLVAQRAHLPGRRCPSPAPAEIARAELSRPTTSP